MRRILLILPVLLGGIACSRVVEQPGQTAGATELPQGTMVPDTEAFVRATVEIACLATRIPDPRDRVDMVWSIYRRYGFEDPDAYLALVRSVGQQTAVQARIAQGIEQCP